LLESLDVFPGYYDRFTKHIKPRFIYIMSKQKHSLEEVTRMTMNVKKQISHPFDAAYCEITIGNKVCGGLRIAGLEDYPAIKKIQSMYVENGLQLKKKVKHIENTPAVIMVRKFFNLYEFSEQIYLSKTEKDLGYFTVEYNANWEQFVSNVKSLRNNWDGNSFDAAKSFIYQNSEIIDLVRIYSQDITGEFLTKLREAYLKYAPH